jgi:hypothetical protein
VEFVRDWLSGTALRGQWCDIVLNAYVSTDNKSYDIKGSFYTEWDHFEDRHRWEGNSKINLKNRIGLYGMD